MLTGLDLWFLGLDTKTLSAPGKIVSTHHVSVSFPVHQENLNKELDLLTCDANLMSLNILNIVCLENPAVWRNLKYIQIHWANLFFFYTLTLAFTYIFFSMV